MKEFKIISKTKSCSEPFVDWYFAENESHAIELAKDEAKSYGLPEDTQFTATEVPQGTITK